MALRGFHVRVASACSHSPKILGHWGRPRFVELIDAFGSVIERRHREMLTFLAEPRTVQELADHRFLYRPHVEGPYVDPAERRTASLHLERMLARAEAVEVEPGRFQRI